jgi:hypothetical protein
LNVKKVLSIAGAIAGALLYAVIVAIAFREVPSAPGPIELLMLVALTLVMAAAGAAVGFLLGCIVSLLGWLISRGRGAGA